MKLRRIDQVARLGGLAAGPISALFLFIMIIGTPAFGQGKFANARVEIPGAPPGPGEHAIFNVILELPENSHVNASRVSDPNLIPTVFTPAPVAGIIWGIPQYPAPVEVVESYSVDPLKVYRNGSVISVPFTVEKNAARSIRIGGVLYAQACDDEQCYPPKRVAVSFDLMLAGTGSVEPVTMRESGKTEIGPLKIEDVPDFSFTDFSGKARKFSEFKGKVVLLDFWATWCGPCLADIPKLKIIYEKYKSQGFEIIGMDSETIGDDEAPDASFAKETSERAHQIVKTRGVSWTLAEADRAVPIAKNIFGVKSLPTKILIDKNGRIVARIGEKEDLEKIISDLMNEK